MRMVAWALVALVAGGAAAFGEAGGTPGAGAPATQGAGTMAAGGKWAGVVRGLSSADFKEREAAQKALEGATWRDLEALRGLAKGASDAEVKGRVEQRVAAMEEALAVEPAPVSVHVKDAELGTVAAALTEQTGMAWTAGGAPKTWRFTLDVVDRPLWEVVMALDAQHALEMQGSLSIHVQPSNETVVRGEVEGAFLIYPVELSRRMRFQEGNGELPEMVLRFGVRGDPRLNVARMGKPVVTRVVGEGGKVVFERAASGEEGDPVSSSMVQEEATQLMPMAAGMGKKVTVSGEVHAWLVVKEQVVEVPDVAKERNVLIAVGSKRAVRFTHWLMNTQAQEVEVTAEVDNTEKGKDRQNDRVPVTVRLVDAGGTTVWQVHDSRGSGSFGATVDLRGARMPLKAVLGVAEKIREVRVPFVFKDLPVP
jgi:hypothetical protein